MMGSCRIDRKIASTFWFMVAGLFIAGSVPEAATYNITVDGSAKKGTVPHFWSECVGCGSMEMCMRKDVQAHFKMAAEELGMKRVRGHGMIEGWMSPSHGKMDIFRWDGVNNPTYNFKNLDSVIGAIKSLGMQPAIELSFMPKDLRAISSKSTCRPKNWDVWRDLVYEIVKHCKEKYGAEEIRSWYWEIWNEPDNTDFWDCGDKNIQMSEYYKLYDKAVEGALKADSLIQIGGPVTCTTGPEPDFVAHCKSKGTKLSFLSNHSYAGSPGPSVNPPGITWDNRSRYGHIKASKLKMGSINTEYNTTWAGQGGNQTESCKSMDSHFNAVFAAKVIKVQLDDHTYFTTVKADTTPTCAPLPSLLSYWVISDIFDEGWHIENYNKNNNANLPFGSVFGMITYQGVRKAVFNGFKMLNMMGDTRLSFTGGTLADGVDGFATVNKGNNEMCVLIYNCYNTIVTTGSDEVQLTINKIPLEGKLRVTHYRVDETHSNPYKIWLNQNKPTNPSTSQWDAMKAAQHLAEIEPSWEFNNTGSAFTKTFQLSRQGVSLIVLKSPTSTKSASKVAKLRTTLAVNGSRVFIDAPAGNPVRVTLYGLDGKVLTQSMLNNGKGSIDAGRYHTAGGFCIVRAEANGQSVMKKVFIQ